VKGRAASFREDAVVWSAQEFRFAQRDGIVCAFQVCWPVDGRAVISSIVPDASVTITLPPRSRPPYPHCLALKC
jgi:hypothetical protein